MFICCRSISALVTGQRYHLARLAKLFEGFLDDGPQFVLKLVVVVLYGVGLSDEDGITFPLSWLLWNRHSPTVPFQTTSFSSCQW